MTSLSRHDREAIFKKVCRLVETKHFNPKLNGVDWNCVVEARREQPIPRHPTHSHPEIETTP